MYIRGLIPRNFAELDEEVPIILPHCHHLLQLSFCFRLRTRPYFGLSYDKAGRVLENFELIFP